MVPCHELPRRPDRSRAGDRTRLPITEQLLLRLPADWLAPSLSRRRMRHWLAAHRCFPDQIDDLVLVVSEAVSNSIEHGYRVPRESVGHPGVVELAAAIVTDGDGERRIRVTVRDNGVWRPEPEGHPYRRLGLPLMRAMMDTVSVQGSADGTTVVLLSYRAFGSPTR